METKLFNIKDYRRENRSIIYYLYETWVNEGQQRKKYG